MSSEQRRKRRRAVWVPVEVDGGGRRILSVSDDVSSSGVRLVSPVLREVGARVELSLHFPDGSSRTVGGKVVRVEKNEDDPDGMFPHRVAVAFEEPIDELDGLLEEVEQLESSLS